MGGNGCYAKSAVLNILVSTTPAKPTLTKNVTGNTFCEGANWAREFEAKRVEKLVEALVKINSKNPAQLKTLIVSGDMRGTCGLLQDVAQDALAQHEQFKKDTK